MDPTQKVFLGVAGGVLLITAFRGWRLGPVRQLISVVALLAAYLTGWYFGGAAVPMLRPLKLPNIVLETLGGMGVGVLTYVVIVVSGGFLFGTTRDQRGALRRFVYGVSGAFLGMLVGLVLVLAVAIGIRLLGTLADGISPENPKGAIVGRQPRPGPTPRDWLRTWPVKHPDGPVAPPDAPSPTGSPSIGNPAVAAASALVQLKRLLNEGIVGEVVQTIDPVPRETYETIGKIGRLSSRPDAIGRLLSYPGAKELVNDPAIAALQNDPEIAEAIQKQNLAALMRNPKVIKICNNANTAAKLKSFELRKALDYALAQ